MVPKEDAAQRRWLPKGLPYNTLHSELPSSGMHCPVALLCELMVKDHLPAFTWPRTKNPSCAMQELPELLPALPRSHNRWTLALVGESAAKQHPHVPTVMFPAQRKCLYETYLNIPWVGRKILSARFTSKSIWLFLLTSNKRCN